MRIQRITSPRLSRLLLAHHIWCLALSRLPILSFSRVSFHTLTLIATALGVNYQQLPVNSPRVPYRYGNFQRDGSMAFYNQGSRPNYLSSIEPITFRSQATDLDKVHGHFVGQAVVYMSEIRPEDFNAPRALWEKVFDEAARERFIKNISGHMENCSNKDIIKRQIGIFRKVSEDIASRLEKATGVTGVSDIADLDFNGTHNGLKKGGQSKGANGMKPYSVHETNGGPPNGHAQWYKCKVGRGKMAGGYASTSTYR